MIVPRSTKLLVLNEPTQDLSRSMKKLVIKALKMLKYDEGISLLIKSCRDGILIDEIGDHVCIIGAQEKIPTFDSFKID